MNRKIQLLSMAIILLLSLSVVAFATEPEDSLVYEPQYGDPIWITSYVDEDGNDIVEKIYFAPDPDSESDGLIVSSNGDISVMSETSGKGWYKKEKQIANTNHGTMYVEAYFVWGNGDVSVSSSNPSPRKGYSGIGSAITVSGEVVTTGTGRFAGVFNKYAYAQYSFLSKNPMGYEQGNIVKVTVSQSGNVS